LPCCIDTEDCGQARDTGGFDYLSRRHAKSAVLCR
jgi:hypothetical protein